MGIYAGTQWIWGILYLIVMLVLSYCAGIFFVQKGEGEITDPVERFLIGFSLTPVAVAVWMILVSFLPRFAGKQYAAFFVPFAAAVIYLLRNRKAVTGSIKAAGRLLASNVWSMTVTALILVIFLYKLFSVVSGCMVYHDAAFYMGEALHFSDSLSWHDISTYADMGDGMLNGSIHNFIWPAYISYGMICTGYRTLGPSYDLAAYFSVQLTPLYLMTAIWGAIYMFSRKTVLCCWGILLFFLTPISDVIGAYNRDFFRMIPLILIVEFFYMEIYRLPKGGRFSKTMLTALMLTAFFIPSGHPINVFVAVPIGICWVLCHILLKRDIRTMLPSIAAILAGGIAGSYNMIYALLMTGSINGNCSLYFNNIFEGTALNQVYIDFMASTMSMDEGLPVMLSKIFIYDKYRLNLLGTILSASYCIWCCFRAKKKGFHHLFVCLSYFLSVFLIVAGHFFSWGGFTYDEWLSRNFRYAFQFYILAIPCIVLAADSFLEGRKIERFAIPSVVLLSGVLSAYALKSYDVGVIREWEEYAFTHAVEPVLEAVQKAGEDGNVLIGQSTYAYASGLKAKVLPSYYGVDLFRAENERDVAEYFRENKIEFVCLDNTYLNAFWQYGFFYNCMQNMEHVKLIEKTDLMEVYQMLETPE